MDVLAALLLLTGVYPLAEALRANRRTTLRQTLLWALLAWAAWTGVAWSRVLRPDVAARVADYGALCLSGSAGFAVLGARRPGVSAWNFIVIVLLAVLFSPILNRLGELRLEPIQELFLAAILLFPLLNYLPTRLAPGVVLAAAGYAGEMARLMKASPAWMPSLGLLLLALGPWAAWAGLANRRRKPPGSEFDRRWLAYRDRFGFVWGQRMREQFNRAAHHAGWPVELRWRGLHATAPHPSPDEEALLTTLRAVLKRFGPEDEEYQSRDR